MRGRGDTLKIEVHREGRRLAVAASVSNTDYSGDVAGSGLTLGTVTAWPKMRAQCRSVIFDVVDELI
jgi:hypothetical protein